LLKDFLLNVALNVALARALLQRVWTWGAVRPDWATFKRFFARNCLAKVAKIFRFLWDYLEKQNLLSKSYLMWLIFSNWWKNWATFHYNIWSHCTELKLFDWKWQSRIGGETLFTRAARKCFEAIRYNNNKVQLCQKLFLIEYLVPSDNFFWMFLYSKINHKRRT